MKWHGSPSAHDQQRLSLPGDGFAAGIWLSTRVLFSCFQYSMDFQSSLLGSIQLACIPVMHQHNLEEL